MISSERVKQMQENFWAETNSPDSVEWRESLTNEERALVAAWDTGVDTGMANMAADTLSHSDQCLQNAILEDSEIRELTDLTPYAEGSGLDEFLDEAKIAYDEMCRAGLHESSLPVRILLFARSCYLLGVMRGAEGYRRTVSIDQDFETMAFQLSEFCHEEFETDLRQYGYAELKKALMKLGIIIK